MEILILLTVIGILWLISPRKTRRYFVTPLAIVLTCIVLLTSPWVASLANWGLTASLPADTGEKADAIVILGRGPELRNRRIEIAEELWQAKRAPQIFISGMLDAREMIEQLTALGVSPNALSGEACSQSTYENAEYTAALLYPKGVRKVLLITDPSHMQRSVRLFQSFGFKAIPHISPLPPQLSPMKALWLSLREYGGLLDYQRKGLFQPVSKERLEQPDPQILHKFSDWYCVVKGEKKKIQ